MGEINFTEELTKLSNDYANLSESLKTYSGALEQAGILQKNVARMVEKFYSSPENVNKGLISKDFDIENYNDILLAPAPTGNQLMLRLQSACQASQNAKFGARRKTTARKTTARKTTARRKTTATRKRKLR